MLERALAILVNNNEFDFWFSKKEYEVLSNFLDNLIDYSKDEHVISNIQHKIYAARSIAKKEYKKNLNKEDKKELKGFVNRCTEIINGYIDYQNQIKLQYLS